MSLLIRIKIRINKIIFSTKFLKTCFMLLQKIISVTKRILKIYLNFRIFHQLL